MQGTSTELLKAYVFNEPVMVAKPKQSDTFKVSANPLRMLIIAHSFTTCQIPDLNPKTTPSTSVDKPISFKDKKGKKNEIFVDIYERISITFNSNVLVSLRSSRDPRRACAAGLCAELLD